MAEYASRYILANDGLKLHVRDYGVARAGQAPILCLPGLARTAADFDPLARHLIAADPTRRVLAVDYRGRGLSAWDARPEHYDLPIESADILAVLDALGVARVVVVGSSRGGLHAMMLAAMRPSLLAGAVINDIGPFIEASGLSRIRGYVGKLPRPASWAEAVAVLKTVAAAQFTGLDETDWQAYAETTFRQENGTFVPLYDPALMHNLARMDLAKLPTLWPQFEALGVVPVLVVRGENSDLLSAGTAVDMVRRLPDAKLVTVPGQGHAPLLKDRPTLEAIDAFVSHCASAAVEVRQIDNGLSLLS